MKRIVSIQDISSVGKCSLTVALPIISAMGVEAAVLPTAVLSTHTAIPGFTFHDLTGEIRPICDHWKKMGYTFDSIYTGYLGSFEQLDLVSEFFDDFGKDSLIFIDPVMGDYGRLYPTYDRARADSMRSFLEVADIITPNLTEACILAEEPYRTDFSDGELAALCARLSERNGCKVVISGIPRGDSLVNFIYEPGGRRSLHAEEKIGCDRSGTGDVFASVVLGDAVNGVDFAESVRRASSFTAQAVRRTVEMGLPPKDGLAIEEVLGELTA